MRQAIAALLVVIAGLGVVALLARTPRAPPRAKPPADPSRLIAKRLPRDEQLRQEPLPAALEPLRSIAVPKVAPREGDWLAEHPEDGQSLAQHRVDCVPVPERVLYLVPVGELSTGGRAVLDQLEPLLAAHFQLPVKRLPAMDPKLASKSERQGQLGTQWLAADILDALVPTVPKDAAAVMAVTDVDLYPDPQWNFVFGQASYEQRVGVMSLARLGELPLEATLVLERAYATGMHEMGHMLQVLHCIAWECPMNGCNHQEESDTRPLEPCPHCLAKLMRATGLDPAKRRTELRAAWEKAGLTRGVKEIDAALTALASADAGVSSVP